jgi:transcriptional regulator with XRE-family HTH domain
MKDERDSAIRNWRVAHSMTVEQLANACGMAVPDAQAAQLGSTGIPGELQDYLTTQGLYVSQMTSDQSVFIVTLRAETNFH